MTGRFVTSRGIFFRVRDPFTSQIVSWRRDVDEAVMRYQLGRRSRILVCGLRDQGLTHITEMPARGEFMPYYGVIGGGFEFIFHSAGELTEITVEAAVSQHPMFHPDPIEPLQLAISAAMLTQAEVLETIGTVAPGEATTYLPEFLFGFYGQFMDIFHGWKWYSEDAEKYDFTFVPTSVGTMASIRHRKSKSVLDLTRDVKW